MKKLLLAALISMVPAFSFAGKHLQEGGPITVSSVTATYGISAATMTISSLANTVLAVNGSGVVISTTVSGGGGAVTSVNGYTGVVSLTVDDIAGAVSSSGNTVYTGQVNASSATLTIPFRTVSAPSTSCATGELVRVSTEDRIYKCIAGKFRPLNGSDSKQLYEENEFAWYAPGSSAFSEQFWRASGGCGGLRANATAIDNHPGILRQTTAGTAFDICAIVRGGISSTEYISGLNAKTFDQTWIIRLGSTITSYSLYVGFLLSETISNTNSLYFRFDTTTGDTGFVGRACAASSCNNTPTLVSATADAWYTLRMRSTTAGTVLFSACSGDGCTLGAEQSLTSIPSVPLSPGLLLQTATASARFIDTDYYSMSAEVAR